MAGRWCLLLDFDYFWSNTSEEECAVEMEEWPVRLEFLKGDEYEIFFGVWGKNPLGECACRLGVTQSDDGRDHRFGERGKCTSPGKHPVVFRMDDGLHGFRHGWRDAVSWQEWEAGVGADVRVLGGRTALAVPGNVWVLDCDNPKAWRGLVRLFKTGVVSFDEVLAVARTVRGWHVWLLTEREGWIGSTAQHVLNEVLDVVGAQRGLEVKSGGGYVVVPDGREREWVDVMTFAQAVAFTSSVFYGKGSGLHTVAGTDLLSGDPPPVPDAPEAEIIEQWQEWSPEHRAQWGNVVWDTLEQQAALLAKAPAGTRNNRLNATSWYRGRYAVLGGRLYAEVSALLVAAGMAAGLEERECRATVRSGLRGLESGTGTGAEHHG